MDSPASSLRISSHEEWFLPLHIHSVYRGICSGYFRKPTAVRSISGSCVIPEYRAAYLAKTSEILSVVGTLGIEPRLLGYQPSVQTTKLCARMYLQIVFHEELSSSGGQVSLFYGHVIAKDLDYLSKRSSCSKSCSCSDYVVLSSHGPPAENRTQNGAL